MYRIFRLPINETVYEYPTVTQLIATDLGTPCRHPHIECWHKQRRWGLLLCKAPCINGIHRLSGHLTWYDQGMSEKVMALATHEPSLKIEFAERVLRDHDYKFVRTVLREAGIDDPLSESP